ncbi:MAG: hypothetical protein NXH73_11860 [Flavobacteriaceae bacterium]|nr:hypothetical protein [Flavobacteriaceae bacterium]
MKNYLTLTLAIFFVSTLQLEAQKNFKEFNVIGVSGGLTLYDINTDDFTTTSRESYMLGFQMRGNVYNNFDMIYGISFYDTKIGISASSTPVGGNKEVLDYNMQSAQVSVLWGYKVIREHLSVEAGPILNVNGKLTLKDTPFENYIVDGYTTVRAIDLEDVSKVNFHLAAGLTAGFRNFRIFGQYQYGVTNVLNKLNSQNLENSNFKGNSSLLTVGVTAYF